MRILFVHEQAGFQGGAEANVHQVAEACGELGHEVDLLYQHASDGSNQRFFGTFENHWQFEDFDAAIAGKPDVIYVHKTSDLDILRKLTGAGLPLVRMVHDHDMYCQRSSRYFPWSRTICTRKAGYACAITCGVVRNRKGKLPFKFAWPGRKLEEIRLCKKFHTHIVQTDFMKSELTLHGFDPYGIRILPVAPQQRDITEKENYDAPNILFVGQLLRGKGVDFLLRALAIVRDLELAQDWKCTIAGEGSHLATCQELAAELKLTDRVTFVGRLSREELAQQYQQARLGVVPSVWPEPMGMVGLEFMWASLPVVAFDAGGIGHWLEDSKTGYLAEPKDIASFAGSVAKLLEDQSLAETMGRYARSVAEGKYRHDHYLAHLLQILEDATRSEPRSAALELTRVPLLKPSAT